jgi:hypothetical protein
MKYRIILDCTAESLPTMAMTGPSVKDYTERALSRCTIDRMSIENTTPVEGDLISIDECHCLDGAGEQS